MMRLFSAPQDVLRPNITSRALKDKILTSNKQIIEHDFGLVLGKVYFVKPDDEEMLADLIKQLNQQPDVRKTRLTSAWIAGGVSLLSLPTEKAKPHHHLFTRGLSNSDKYIAYTLDALKQFDVIAHKKLRLTALVNEPAYRLLARGLFEVEDLPQDSIDAFKGFTALITGEKEDAAISDDLSFKNDKRVSNAFVNFANKIHSMLHATCVTSALDWFPQFAPFREARDAYVAAAKNFLLGRADIIKQNLLKYANNEEIQDVIALSMIELIKQQNERLKIDRNFLNWALKDIVNDEEDPDKFTELLLDEYIITVPSNIFAAGNLAELVPCILHALGKNRKMLRELRESFENYGLESDLENLHQVIEKDKKENGLFHRIYLEGMRLRVINPRMLGHQFGDLFNYYVTNPMTVGGETIQGGSVVCVMNAMRQPNDVFGGKRMQFNPDRMDTEQKRKLPLTSFSYLPRRCPAFHATEYIAKTYIAYLVMNYDFELFSQPREWRAYKCYVEFKGRDCVNESVPKPSRGSHAAGE